MNKTKKIVRVALATITALQPVAAGAQTLTISVQDAQFTKPVIERLVKEYSKVAPGFEAVVITKGDADARVTLSAESHVESVGRFVVLPVANSGSELLHNKKVQRGLTDKVQRQVYVERDVMEALDDEESGQKPLPGTVYCLCGQKAVSTQVLANQLQVAPARLRGKKVLGREENLLAAVKSNADAVSYNVATLLYDRESRRPVSGLTVLAVDLDGNGRVSDEERSALVTLDALTAYLQSHPDNAVPTGQVNISVATDGLRSFVAWAKSEGQRLLADYGMLALR